MSKGLEMAENTEYENGRESDRPAEGARRNSGIKAKYDKEMMDKIREQIDIFRREKFGVDSSCEIEEVVVYPDENDDAGFSANAEFPFIDEERLRDVIVRCCGRIYWDFLDSGHPLARFWVQLKNGLEVIPRSEYIYYVQSFLGKVGDSSAALGSSRIKMEFMQKYGFESDGEVEEYLLTILEEADVENIIGVE